MPCVRSSFLAFCLGSCLVSLSTVSPARAEWDLDSRTLWRVFEREDAAGDSHTVLPLYEYLGVDWGALEDKGLSAHFYGWGRYDFGDDFFDDRTEAELLHLYLQYSGEANNLNLRLGRQRVFEGVANESLDGVRVGGDLTDYFAGSFYAGLPVAVETVDGRGGDWLVGGRFGHHLGLWYEMGLSYKRLANDGSRAMEDVGFDAVGRWPGMATLTGTSVRSLVTDHWKEHAYELHVPLGSLTLRGLLERYEFDAYFDAGDRGAAPFLAAADSGERLTAGGGDIRWKWTDSLEVTWLSKIYDYRQRGGTALYNSARLGYSPAESDQAGGELGWMNGDSADTRYLLGRGYGYWTLAWGFIGADLTLVRYAREIEGEDLAVFASASGGRLLLDDTLELSLSGDYSSDPFFDHDLRAMLIAKYRLWQ